MPRRERLEAGGARLQPPPVVLGLLGVVHPAPEDPVELADHLLLREVERVGLRDRRKQPPLVDAVVEQERLGV